MTPKDKAATEQTAEEPKTPEQTPDAPAGQAGEPNDPERSQPATALVGDQPAEGVNPVGPEVTGSEEWADSHGEDPNKVQSDY
jgi:hypothetical protein